MVTYGELYSRTPSSQHTRFSCLREREEPSLKSQDLLITWSGTSLPHGHWGGDLPTRSLKAQALVLADTTFPSEMKTLNTITTPLIVLVAETEASNVRSSHSRSGIAECEYAQVIPHDLKHQQSHNFMRLSALSQAICSLCGRKTGAGVYS